MAYGDGPSLHMVFAARQPENYRDVLATDHAKLLLLHERLLSDGIFIDPGLRILLSAAHTEEDIDLTLQAFDRAIRAIQ